MNGKIEQVPFELEIKEVEEETAIALRSAFMPFFEEANKLTNKANAITVTDITQTEEMALARDTRLKLKNIRVEVEKQRKTKKEASLREGKAIDGMANIIKYLIVPVEEHLQEQEDFVKRQELKRRLVLVETRVSELCKYDVETEFYNLGDMSNEGYLQLLETSKLVFKQKRDAEERAERDRIANEKAAAEERERINQENVQLKKEAEERDRLAKTEQEQRAKIEATRKTKEAKERAILEAKLKKEHDAKAKVEAELKRKYEIEAKHKRESEAKILAEKNAIEKTDREARLAPDKKKLERLAVMVQKIQMPEVTSTEAKRIVSGAVELLNKTSNYIKEKSVDL